MKNAFFRFLRQGFPPGAISNRAAQTLLFRSLYLEESEAIRRAAIASLDVLLFVRSTREHGQRRLT